MTNETRRAIEYKLLDDLKEDPRNPKTHNVEAVHDSIQRFGVLDPIVVDGRTGYIISGHGRRKALKRLQHQGGQAPTGVSVEADGSWHVPVLTGWQSADEFESSAALIALNRTTEIGGWADESLLELLEELSQDDSGLDGVGFDEEALDKLREFYTPPENWDAEGLGQDEGYELEDSEEIDTDSWDFSHQCPSCGFEYN